jgi:predicted small lipoprotein YifL
MKTRVATLLILAPALASCGLAKPLDRPPPLWGEARAKYEADQQRLKAEAATHAAGKPAPATRPAEAPPPPRPTISSSPLDAPTLPPN